MKARIFLTTICLIASAAVAQPPVLDSPFSVNEAQDIATPFNSKLNDPLKGSFYVNETTLEDQTDIAVTVYNNNIALVRDQRKVTMYPGELSLNFADVAEQIRPETVSLRSLSQPGALHILEQNYEYDLINPAKLMEKYVGKKVRLVNFSNEIGFTEVSAELLSTNGGPIYKVDDEIYLGHPGTVVLPEIPENLIAKPSLIWKLSNDGTDHEIEVTYITGGIAWKADYVLTMNRAETMMDLAGWVTLNNGSGATYKNARLKLVAGEVNIAPKATAKQQVGFGWAASMRPEIAPMREESFAEYHLYTLPRRTTIKQNQSKQVSLLTASRVSVGKVYEFRGQTHFYSQKIPTPVEQKVAVFLKFKNEKSNNLGMPLPAGVMRVYQEDSDGMLQFSGEDKIKHTPKDEDIKLRLGNAFDVVGERVQTDFERRSNNVFESEFKITLRNHKESNITVDIVEPLPGDWSILDSSHEYSKKDAHTAVFSVPVRRDGETEVTYRVRVRT